MTKPRYESLEERVDRKLRERRVEAIKQNIVVLADTLHKIHNRAEEAATASANDQTQDGAIGGLMSIQPDLDLVASVLQATLALHRA